MMRAAAPFLVAAILLSGCSGSSRSPSPSAGQESGAVPLAPLQALSYRGTGCAELAFLIPTPVANVQSHVAKPYTVFVTNGMATLVVAASKCRTAQVAGNTTTDQIESDVGVFINDPEGEPTPATYQFWKATNRDALASSLARVGLPILWAPASNLLSFSVGGAQSVFAHLSVGNETYDLNGTTAPAPVGSAPIPAQSFRWYHADANATTRIRYDLAYTAIGPASGDVHAQPGSVLHKLLGKTSASGQGTYWTFGLTVEATRTPK